MPTRKEMANAIRFLSMDAIQKANSGHPGMPMGMADIAQVLWCDFLKHNPANPAWADRDRFVLSNGHGSMLLYSLLHLTGYGLTTDDLASFRQLGSKTPGHPENGVAPGVETTTGPLGQGLTNAVGMAMAEKVLAAQYNRPGFDVVDHYTYVFLGDGCLMEGISHEACSLAGTLGLGKLIVLYDDNGISIDGAVSGWFADDTAKRFKAYGWHVLVVNGHDPKEIRAAIKRSRERTDKPSLICCKTTIGFGSPSLAGSHKTHGSPLGDEEIAATRKALGWEYPPFSVPREIKDAWDATARGGEAEAVWNDMFEAYARAFPAEAAAFTRRMSGALPADWTAKADAFVAATVAKAEKKATRQASQAAINGYAPELPELFGGSADLTPSNGTWWTGSVALTRDNWNANYVHFGVREFGMAAIMNGMALHGGFIPYGGTFLVFADYSRNAIRMAALTGAKVIHVLTHDSIGVGEDGPTHQPVEHTPSLRLIPGLSVWRPCDTLETAVAWRAALERAKGPTALALTRQGLPFMPRDAATLANVAKGGYVLRDCDATPDAILLATGSEVHVAMAAADQLTAKGYAIRVVSMPSVDTFEAQDAAYKEGVLPKAVTIRVAVEAASPDGWYRYAPRVIGMTTFGESGPGGALFKHFGFTPENVAATVEEELATANVSLSN
ncbi:MAG: transketolase [Desulfovibrionaceae bacterium]